MKITGTRKRRILSAVFVIAAFVLLVAAGLFAAIVLPQIIPEEKAETGYAFSPIEAGNFEIIDQAGLKEIDMGKIFVIHDNVRHVTCWVISDPRQSTFGNGSGISCVPDDYVVNPP